MHHGDLCAVTKAVEAVGRNFASGFSGIALEVLNFRLGGPRSRLFWIRHAPRRSLREGAGGWTRSRKIGPRLQSKWYSTRLELLSHWQTIVIPSSNPDSWTVMELKFTFHDGSASCDEALWLLSF
jgi:hypothetical protein